MATCRCNTFKSVHVLRFSYKESELNEQERRVLKSEHTQYDNFDYFIVVSLTVELYFTIKF